MATSSCNAALYNTAENDCIPHEFICPLTLEIMVYPLMDRSGRSYERTAILEWITKNNSTCPMTRQPLLANNLLPNNKLRKEILQWREFNGDDITADLSQDEDAIQVQEITRAIRVWEENYLNDDIAVASVRRNRSRRRRHHQQLRHLHLPENTGTTTASRFMRIFNRSQQGY